MHVIAEKYAHQPSGQIGTSDEPLIQRAITAHIRLSPRAHVGGKLIQPRLVQLVEWEDKQYVVLWWPGFRDRILSVYRVRAYDGVLRLMKRSPAGLGQALRDLNTRVS